MRIGSALKQIFIFFVSFIFSSTSWANGLQSSPCLQIRQSVVVPIMQFAEIENKVLEDLLVGTAAVESHSGKYNRQINGPALGIMQVEPSTYRHMKNAGLILPRIEALAGEKGGNSKDMLSKFYSAGVALSYYLDKMRHYKLPRREYTTHKEYVEYLWKLGYYYKARYNTHLGAGSAGGFVAAWFRDGCYIDYYFE